jgi:hypothetical protein
MTRSAKTRSGAHATVAPVRADRGRARVPRRCTLDGFAEAVSRSDGIALGDPDPILKLAWFGVGLHMEFHYDGGWVVTSPVRSLTVLGASALPGPF